MTKKVQKISIIIICFSLIVAAFIPSIINNSKKEIMKDFIVDKAGNSCEIYNFECTDLIPAKSMKYQINAKSFNKGIFNVELSFNESNNGGLSEFITVIVKVNNITIEKNLKQLFDGDKITFNVELSKAKTPIIVEYLMPLSTGNEAKNTSTSFQLIFKAKVSGNE